MSTLRGYLLVGSAVVACPCHLPFTAALVGGTAVGGVLADNFGLVVVAGTVYFVAALVLGMRLLGRDPIEPACGACGPSPEAPPSADVDRQTAAPRPEELPAWSMTDTEASARSAAPHGR